jgi:hypothetical protein
MIRKVFLVTLLALFVATSAWAGFVNGNFETGDYSGWTQGAGYWGGGWPINPTNYLPGGSSYTMGYYWQGTITSAGTDPNTGGALSTVYSGAHSARLNNYVNDNSVGVISQTVTNWQDSNIYFAWAAVLEASHGLTDSDNFTLKLTDDTAGTTLFEVSYTIFAY